MAVDLSIDTEGTAPRRRSTTAPRSSASSDLATSGLPLAVEFAKAGFKVIGYDVSERVVRSCSWRASRTSRTSRAPTSRSW